MEVMCILCELVIAVCTLLSLFNLKQAVDRGREGVTQRRRRYMALASCLAFTVGVLAVTAVGTDKLARGAGTVWARVSATRMIRLSGAAIVPATIEKVGNAEAAIAIEGGAGEVGIV